MIINGVASEYEMPKINFENSEMPTIRFSTLLKATNEAYVKGREETIIEIMNFIKYECCKER